MPDDTRKPGGPAASTRPRETGPTAVVASRSDPRFSYCLYVPPDLDARAHAPELVVAVHGSARFFTGYRDAFTPFARANHCVVLAPLFPIGVRGDGNRDGYKYLQEGDIRYDDVLLSMVNEVAEAYGIAVERFALFGYSGGGQFVHRFFMLHSDRLWALSVGAPGTVTLLDRTRDWWIGIRNMKHVFGIELDLAGMRRVPVQLVVGSADLETWEITHHAGEPYWMPGANDAGRTRPERLIALQRSWHDAGIAARLDVVPNTAHDWSRCVPVAAEFFAEVLAERRERERS